MGFLQHRGHFEFGFERQFFEKEAKILGEGLLEAGGVLIGDKLHFREFFGGALLQVTLNATDDAATLFGGKLLDALDDGFKVLLDDAATYSPFSSSLRLAMKWLMVSLLSSRMVSRCLKSRR